MDVLRSGRQYLTERGDLVQRFGRFGRHDLVIVPCVGPLATAFRELAVPLVATEDKSSVP